MSASNDSDGTRKEVGLPALVFTFTLDQVAAMLSVDVPALKRKHLFYAGRDQGKQSPDTMWAVNISDPSAPAEWRIAHKEFVRYVRHKGFRLYDLTRTW